MAQESSVVNVLVGVGLAIVQAVAQANLRQPRYTARVRTNDHGTVDVEPLRRRRRPRQMGMDSQTSHPVHRGPGDGMHERIHSLNWGPTGRRASRADEANKPHGGDQWLGCGHSKRRHCRTLQPAVEPRATGRKLPLSDGNHRRRCMSSHRPDSATHLQKLGPPISPRTKMAVRFLV